MQETARSHSQIFPKKQEAALNNTRVILHYPKDTHTHAAVFVL